MELKGQLMTISNALNLATATLKDKFERPRLEAEILLAHHLGYSRIDLILRDKEELRDTEGFLNLVKRRANFEPIEYITSKVSFYLDEFYIAKGALIPRPETEILVDKALEIIDKRGLKNIAEIGVGSGAISVTLAKLRPNLNIVATDISKEALRVARVNIKKFRVDKSIKLYHTSLLDGVKEELELIISNPPYIDESEILEPNVANFEPKEALFAKDRGLKLIKEIILIAKDRDLPLVCEMGYNQKEPLIAFFKEQNIKNYSFYKDLASLDRGFTLL